jgi:hypothetical protein
MSGAQQSGAFPFPASHTAEARHRAGNDSCVPPEIHAIAESYGRILHLKAMRFMHPLAHAIKQKLHFQYSGM